MLVVDDQFEPVLLLYPCVVDVLPYFCVLYVLPSVQLVDEYESLPHVLHDANALTETKSENSVMIVFFIVLSLFF
ncbi:hypothetical protein VCR4J5_1500078 [Vibrio crassostreae]|uniref:Uncharacterized protein n=1 Tax=Vibrio crassostreae TaxID=246167 RepID=A0ABM9QP91_9VIBR|nr:hypothetical protein VCR19J5_1210272 [Vibrio crassostreae]CDT09690.1 hypothetical protein VCR4J5_1500078 [Vibrio crassostreae]